MEKDETQESPKLKVLPAYFFVSHPKNCDTSSFLFISCTVGEKRQHFFYVIGIMIGVITIHGPEERASTCNIKCQALDVHL